MQVAMLVLKSKDEGGRMKDERKPKT